MLGTAFKLRSDYEDVSRALMGKSVKDGHLIISYINGLADLAFLY